MQKLDAVPSFDVGTRRVLPRTGRNLILFGLLTDSLKIKQNKRDERKRESQSKEIFVSVSPLEDGSYPEKNTEYIENSAKLGKIFPLCINKIFLFCLIFGVHNVFIMEVLPDTQRHEGCTC